MDEQYVAALRQILDHQAAQLGAVHAGTDRLDVLRLQVAYITDREADLRVAVLNAHQRLAQAEGIAAKLQERIVDVYARRAEQSEDVMRVVRELHRSIDAKDAALLSSAAYAQSLENGIADKDAELRTSAAYAQSFQEALASKEAESQASAKYVHSLEEALERKEAESQASAKYVHSLEEALERKDEEIRTATTYARALEETVAEKKQ